MTAPRLLSDAFPHQPWNWFFHLQTLQNVKTFPSALNYLVAGNRFQNALLTNLPGTRYSVFSKQWNNVLGSQTRDNLHCSCQLLLYFNFFKVSTLNTSEYYFRMYCVKDLGYLFASIHQKLGISLSQAWNVPLDFDWWLMMLMNIWGRPGKNGGMFI